MAKVVLIDGNSIMNRAFYGVPELTNEQGLHTNAIYGFLNILNKLIDEEKPEYLAVAFDVHAPTFRHKMFEAYKGTRKGMPEELKEQVPVLKELLAAMKVAMLEKAGYEADDILGTLAKRAEKAGHTVSLVSGDRDLLQVATDNIKVRIPKTKGGKTEIEDYNTQEVIDKYSVPPLGIIELKALMGDSSDNISGVPKIGEKTATELIVKYTNIENLKEHISEITKKSIRETLENNFDMAVLSKKLATIDIDADIEYSVDSFLMENPYTKEAYEIVKRLGLKRILERFPKEITDEKSTVKEEIIISDYDEFTKVLDSFNDSALGFLIEESEGNIVFNDSDGQASFNFSENLNNGKSLKLFTKEKVYIIQTSERISEAEIIGKFADFVMNSVDITFATAELKDYLKYIECFRDINLVKEKFFDAKIAAYILNPLASVYDIEDPYDRYVSQIEELKAQDMYDLFKEIEMPLTVVLNEMEINGILVKEKELEEYGNKLSENIAALEKEIKETAGCDFNINSPKQLGEVLFEKMQLKGGKKTKTGYSTAADILEKLAVDNPFVGKILEYRGLTKLKSTYVDGMNAYIENDSRIRSKFNQTVTATGRISSSDPNLQNIPIRTEQGRLIRKCFVPKDGFVFVDADYSQIELRIMAHMSEDERLIEAYRSGRDIHRITASEVFNTPLEEVTDLQRRNAKAVNFGIIYGISSFGLSQGLSISRKEAEEFIANYFVTFPKVKNFLDKLVDGAKKDGYVTTIYKRRRPIPELKSSNFMQRQFGERVAMNAPVQGSAADIMKLAMINVYRRMKEMNLKSKLLLQVHDELLIEASVDEKEIVEKLLHEEMINKFNLSVSLEIDVHSGYTWYDAK